MSEVKEDFLTADPPIPGQNYFCFSAIWPEKTLKRKELFLMKHFLQNLLSDPLRLKKVLDQMDQEQEFSYEEVEDLYESYILSHGEDIFKKFDEQQDFKTSTRGIKIRGSYDTLKEARIRAEVLKRKDPNFDTWIGQVGYWCPIEPHGAGNEDLEQQFSEPVLNQLYCKKRENVVQKETVFDPLVQAEMEKKEASRRESELNELVKINQENLETGRDLFQKETQRKKNEATLETEKRKEEQKKQREKELAKQNSTSDNKKKKNKVKKRKEKTKPSLPTKSDILAHLKKTANKITSSETDTSKSLQTSELSEPSQQSTSSTSLKEVESKENKPNAEEKIKELRNILDSREKVYENKKEIENENMGRVDTNVNNNMMLESDNGADIFDGPDADPWMQRKREAEDNKLDDVMKKIL